MFLVSIYAGGNAAKSNMAMRMRHGDNDKVVVCLTDTSQSLCVD